MTSALILAAGQGTRLRPLTTSRPKCLVSLLGKSLLHRQLSTLKFCGISDIHIVTGFCSEQLSNQGLTTWHNPDYAQTNMVESLFCALPHIRPDGDIVISYGDIVYEAGNLLKVLDSRHDITLMIDKGWQKLWSKRFDDPLSDAETLLLNDDGSVRELGKKPHSLEEIQGQYTGLIKIKAERVSDLLSFYNSLDRKAKYDGQDFLNMYLTSFLQLLINAGWDVGAAKVENGWLEVDSTEDLELYENLHHAGDLDGLYRMDMYEIL